MNICESIHTTDIVRNAPRILAQLLKDQTLSTANDITNITWASKDYLCYSDGKNSLQTSTHYQFNSQIQPEDISGINKDIITPRAFKHKGLQITRAKEMAEVFTPAWLCNAQNNLVDEKWFGRTNVFNKEFFDEDGNHKWEPREEKILFPEGKSWRTYVKSKRLEMTCGEAPYIASPYDTATGEKITIHNRIGIIDRKFRVINENTPSEPTRRNKRQWIRNAYLALQSVYGFDFQGDNVFLARESLLHSFYDYYVLHWKRKPHMEALIKAAEIISWNIWQMDGTSFTIPNTSKDAFIMEWHGTEPLKGKKICFKELIR